MVIAHVQHPPHPRLPTRPPAEIQAPALIERIATEPALTPRPGQAAHTLHHHAPLVVINSKHPIVSHTITIDVATRINTDDAHIGTGVIPARLPAARVRTLARTVPTTATSSTGLDTHITVNARTNTGLIPGVEDIDAVAGPGVAGIGFVIHGVAVTALKDFARSIVIDGNAPSAGIASGAQRGVGLPVRAGSGLRRVPVAATGKHRHQPRNRGHRQQPFQDGQPNSLPIWRQRP